MTLTLDKTGERLDAALARLVPSLSRSQAQRLIEQGAVTHGGRPVKKNEKLSAGDTLELTLPEVREVPIEAQPIPLEVCYEDADVIVVNKPKGLVVHPAPGHADGTLVNALLAHCGDSLSGIGGEKRPGIVHRIDKDTSGLIIAAKNDAAHAALAAQLKDHSLARTYICLVCGRIRDDAGTIDAPIGRHPTDRKKMAVTQKNSRSAVTHWRVLERFAAYTLVECRLETGRTHQIRVHGLPRPPDSGRHGLRPQKAGARAEQPVPAREGASLRAPAHGRAGDGQLRAAGLFHRASGKAARGGLTFPARSATMMPSSK